MPLAGLYDLLYDVFEVNRKGVKTLHETFCVKIRKSLRKVISAVRNQNFHVVEVQQLRTYHNVRFTHG